MSNVVQPASINPQSNSNGFCGGICLSASSSFHSYSFNSWILHSGATSHISHSLHNFVNITWLQDRFVTFPNYTHVPVLASSVVRLAFDFAIHDDLYVPSFKVNLLFVSALL